MEIQQIDSIATQIQNFNPATYTNLVNQFEALAQQRDAARRREWGRERKHPRDPEHDPTAQKQTAAVPKARKFSSPQIHGF